VPGHPDALFTLRKVDGLFFVVALKTQRPPMPLILFHCQNKTNKVVRYGKITKEKQSNRQGRARAVDLPAGHLTWRALV